MVNKLEKIFEETDQINIQTNNICVNCGAHLENEYTTKCSLCGYDISEAFSCPYQVSSSVKINNENKQLTFCELTRKQCKVKALDYEICPTFRSLDLLKTKDE